MCPYPTGTVVLLDQELEVLHRRFLVLSKNMVSKDQGPIDDLLKIRKPLYLPNIFARVPQYVLR